MNRVIRVEHLARVEGHGGITVELDRDTVRGVQFDVFEGLRLIEGLVKGRSFEDVPQIVSRICAICSVAHAVTCIKAIENAFDVIPSEQTVRLRDLLFRGENIESHALHLFLLALPDYLGFPSATAMAAEHRNVVELGLRLKKLGNTIQETIGGRAIHPVNCVVGGFGGAPSVNQLTRLRTDLQRGLRDCERAIDLWASLAPTDFCHSDTVYAALTPPSGYGYYQGSEITMLTRGIPRVMPAEELHLHNRETTITHSHARHSSFDGRPFMVGALGRLAVNGEKLAGGAVTAMQQLGLELPSDNPMDNNKAQVVELMFDIEHALAEVDSLLNEGLRRERATSVRPREGMGLAVTEAPRGLLSYRLGFDGEGRVTSANIITPTAFNASSVEDHFAHAVTQSPDKSTAALTHRLEMIARAYDPCISCSVHVVQSQRDT
ncbi:MAG: Ni/Fe hydrogenase subunit alpha [Gemmatimonadota bacterium]|nr:MAG: Ni/Fe hydrogenase subunit alpha [Gemmatimonadota bacterium]